MRLPPSTGSTVSPAGARTTLLTEKLIEKKESKMRLRELMPPGVLRLGLQVIEQGSEGT